MSREPFVVGDTSGISGRGRGRRLVRWVAATVVTAVCATTVSVAAPAGPAAAADTGADTVADGASGTLQPAPVEVAGAFVAGAPTEASSGAAPTTPSGFTPVVPARLLDTRSGQPTVDGAQAGTGRLPAEGVVTVDVAGRAGVPSSEVRSVVLNVTVVAPDADGFLTVYPSNVPRPLASNVNYRGGDVVASQVVVGVSPDGRVDIFSLAAADLVVDVVGWVATSDDASGSALVPARLVDSRPGSSTVDGRLAGFGSLDAGRSVEVDVLGRGGVPSSGVGAVIVSVAAVDPAGPGFLTVHPDGETRPNSSSVNMTGGGAVANQVVAKLGANGRFVVYSSVRTDVLVDVVGWLAVDSDFAAITPGRLLDTRAGMSTVDGRQAGVGRITAGTTIDVEIGGRAGVPVDGAGSVMLNVTAVDPAGPGFLAVYPKQDEVPTSSSLNFQAGQVVANQVFVQLGRRSVVRIYSPVDTDVVVDIVAWLPPGVNQPDVNAVSLSPEGADYPVLSGGPGTGAASFTIPPGTDLADGDAVALMVNGEPYYGTVTSIVNGVATSVEGNLGTVIPQGRFSAVADESGRLVTEESIGVEQSELQQERAEVYESRSVTSGPVTCVVPSSSGGTPFRVNLETRADVTRFSADADWSFFGGFTGHLIYEPQLSFTAQLDVDVQASCSVERDLRTREFKPITFSIGPIPVVIKHQASLKLVGEIELDAKVGVRFGATFAAKVGVRYDGGFSPVNEISITRQFGMTGKADIQARLGLQFAYEAKLFGVTGIEMALTPYVALRISLANEKWLVLGAGVDATISVVIGIKIAGIEFSRSYELASFALVPQKEIFSASRNNRVGLTSSVVPTRTAVGAPYQAVLAADVAYPGGATEWEVPNRPEPGWTTTATADQKLRVNGTATTVGRKTLEASALVLPAENETDESRFPRQGIGSWTIDVAPRLTAVTVTAPTAEAGAPYTADLSLITGGVGPYTIDDSALPEGLAASSVTSADGIFRITGTPATAETTTVSVTVSDAVGSVPVSVPITFTIVPKTGLSDELFPPVPNGGAYSHSLTITGGLAPFSVRVSGQPPGITARLSGRTLTISGTTTTVGTAPLRVEISSKTGLTTVTRYMTVLAPLTMPYRIATMPMTGQPLLRNDGWMRIEGGQGPFTWQLLSGPEGLTFDTSQSGRRARPGGTTPGVGTHRISVRVTDAIGSTAYTGSFDLVSVEDQRFATLSLPEAVQGAPYSTEVEVGGGVAPFSWRVIGLPPGLTLGGDPTGRLRTITGTPTRFGSYNVEITATDTSNRPGLSKVFTMVVNPPLQGPLLRPPSAIVNQEYTSGAAWSVRGGKPPYIWTYSELPPGLSLVGAGDSSTRPLAGVPTATGSYPVTVSVTDSAGSLPVTRSFTIVVADPIAVDTSGVPEFASTAADFDGQLTATGGVGPYEFSLVDGLPAGLVLQADGSITGRATAATGIRHVVTVLATDADGHEQQATFELWAIHPVGIDLTALPTSVRAGLAYNGRIAPTGGMGPYTYSSTLPPALGWIGFNNANPYFNEFYAARVANLSDGPVTFDVTVRDRFGQTRTETVTVGVEETPPLAMSMAGFPTVRLVDNQFDFWPTVSGGNAPYSWTVSDSPWPNPRLTIDPATGYLWIRPMSTGTFSFTVTVTDASSPAMTVSRTVTITFASELVLDTLEMDTDAQVGTFFSTGPGAGGGYGVRVFSATGLPAGLTISSTTGVISGTPRESGTFDVAISASDDITTLAGYLELVEGEDYYRRRPGPAPFRLTVAAAPAIVIDVSDIPTEVIAGERVSATVSAAGGLPPYTFSASNIPDGIVWDPTQRSFEGVPTASDVYEIEITVTDDLGTQQTVTVTMDVQLDALELLMDDLWTVGHVGVTESLGFAKARGGAGGYRYAVTGTMPPGLTLNTTTGEISGTATQTGTWSPTISATDSGGSEQTATWNIEVKQAITISTPSTMRDYTSNAYIPITVAGYTGDVADLVFTYGGGEVDALGFYTGEISPGPTGNDPANGDYDLTLVCGVQDDGGLGCRVNDTGVSYEPADYRFSIFVSDGSKHGALRWEPSMTNSPRTSVSAGNGYTCATYEDLTARCWGANDAGQLGHTFTAGETPTANRPWLVTDATGAALAGFVSIETNRLAPVGEGYTCGVRRIGTYDWDTGEWVGTSDFRFPDHEIWCWGYGAGGRLGNDASASSIVPVRVQTEDGPLLVSSSTAPTISIGRSHACAAGRCWGTGVLAADHSAVTDDPGLGPTDVALPVSDLTSPSVGAAHLCGTLISGPARCFGATDALGMVPGGSAFHQVYGSATYAAGSFQNDAGVSDVEEVTVGRAHSCLLRSDGEVRCWGDNAQRQLGRADRPATNNTSFADWTGTSVDPTWDTRLAAGGPTGTFIAIAAGGDTTCGIREDDASNELYSVVCWGGAYSAAAGDVTAISAQAYWDRLTVADDHACAWRSEQYGFAHPMPFPTYDYQYGRRPSVVCWGSNSNGQLGIDVAVLPGTTTTPHISNL